MMNISLEEMDIMGIPDSLHKQLLFMARKMDTYELV
jgi:hypothetical protein